MRIMSSPYEAIKDIPLRDIMGISLSGGYIADEKWIGGDKMPNHWGANVTLTYSPTEDEWVGVVVDDLTQFSGTLFSVLAELDDYMLKTYGE